jgi:hypothetical protein
MFCTREGGDPYATDPPALCPRGGTPYDLNSSPPILNYLPKTFSMQKDFPKCACGQDVYVHEVMIPVYDDGGSVDCFEPSLHYYDKCGDCYNNMADQEPPAEFWESKLPMFDVERDELPF